MPASKARLISPGESYAVYSSYAFSNLFALAMTESHMSGRIFGISNGQGLNTDGSGVLFNRKQCSIARKCHNYPYIGST